MAMKTKDAKVVSAIALMWIILIAMFLIAPRLKGCSRGPTRVQQDLWTLCSALRMYELNTGSLPTTRQGLKALVEEPMSPPFPIGWRQILSKPVKDPWGRLYQYKHRGPKAFRPFDLYSLGEDGIISSDDILYTDQ